MKVSRHSILLSQFQRSRYCKKGCMDVIIQLGKICYDIVHISKIPQGLK